MDSVVQDQSSVQGYQIGNHSVHCTEAYYSLYELHAVLEFNTDLDLRCHVYD